MVCGELVASSVKVMVAESAPSEAGVKVPWIVQVPAAATVVPQVLLTEKEDEPAPEIAMLVIARGIVAVLVNVTDCDVLVVPRTWLPNDRLVAERVGAETSPVPLSAMVCGELPALSVIVTAALKGPGTAGVICP